ncbi:hypothetical protein ABPG74_008416 [Tetrahymena malaccensis]
MDTQSSVEYDYFRHDVVDVKGMGKKIVKKNVFNAESPIMNLRFDPEDTMIAAVCGDGSLKIFHLHSDQLKVKVKTGKPNINVPATCLRWRPTAFSASTKNVIVTGGADGQLVHWHVTTGKELNRIEEKGNQINSIDYNKDGSRFITSGSDNKIRLYDESEKSLVSEYKGSEWQDPGHNNRIFSLKFLPDDPNLFISGGWDTNVHIWDIRQGKSVGGFIGPKIGGDALDYQNGHILTGANRSRDQIQIWDFKQRTLIRTVDWNYGKKEDTGAFVYGCQFSKCNSDSIIAGSFGLNEVKLFDQNRDYQPYGYVTGFKKGIYSVDFGNFSNKFAFGGEDGGIFVMSVTAA